MRPIPYTGAAALSRLAVRTLVVRVVLWVLLGLLVLAFASSSRHPNKSAQPILSPKAGGVVVLDLSASITSDTYSRIQETLEQLIGRGGRYGLVVFSNTAYEALPPGTPASELQPLVRYFAVPKAPPGEQPSFPVNPWGASRFTSGTEISAGLDLARRSELENGVRHPSVVLVSDLQDDPDDLQRLTAVLGEYQVEHARLRVIGLNADPNDLARFAGLIGNASSILPAGLATQSHPEAPHTRFPTLLVVLAIFVALLLGAAELRSARLRFGGQAAEAMS